MKMRLRLIGLAAVSFVVLLASCGIPTLINLKVIPADISSDPAIPGGAIAVAYTIVDEANQLQLVEQKNGPSLLLAYIVTNEPDIQTSIDFKALFTKHYIVSSGNTVSSDPVISSAGSSGQPTYTVYKLSDSERTQFLAPDYMAYATTPDIPNVSFYLTYDETEKTVDLTFHGGSYTTNIAGSLRRFNGYPFTSVTSEVLDDPDAFPDYAISDSSGTLYLHLFSAVSVTELRFSNIFWSDLEYLGRFQLN